MLACPRGSKHFTSRKKCYQLKVSFTTELQHGVKNSIYSIAVWDRKWKTTWPLKRQEEFLVGRVQLAKLARGQDMEVSHLLWKVPSDLQWLRAFRTLGLCLIQKMDNNVKEETSEASMIINREDTQDIFPERGEKNGALGTGQNKQKSPWVDGGHSRLQCALHQERTLPSTRLHKVWL